jgi:hypothetical protein
MEIENKWGGEIRKRMNKKMENALQRKIYKNNCNSSC